MNKIRNTKVGKFTYKLINEFNIIALLYSLTLFLKLIYFNTQIGNRSFSGINAMASIGSLLLIASVCLLLKAKTAKRYMSAVNILLTFVIFCNIVFYRYFNDLISIPMIFQASNLSDTKSSMLQLMRLSDLLLLADFTLIPIIQKTLRISFNEVKNNNRIGIAFACLLAGVLAMFFSFDQLVKSQPTILQTFYDRVYVAQNVGLLNYHSADIYAFVHQSINESDKLDEDKKQEIFNYFSEKKRDENTSKLLNGVGKDKNLIVIQIEALQQFVINRSVNGHEITPNLNRLIESGIYFDNYYYQTAGGGTSDAEFTANASMFPMKVGAVYIRKPGNHYYTLPMRMKEAGYTTVAMHGYKPGFWNRSAVYKNIGFDEFYSKSNLKENELLGMGISDKDFFKQAAEKLKKQKEPYFAFLITLSSHFPYDNDKSKYSSFDIGSYKGSLMGDYIEAIHYTDEALGQFIEELNNNDILKDTVLVVYGDHHGIPKDNEKELADFLGKDRLTPFEWQLQQKVPMIINGSGIENMLISTVGGGVDLMPTLLNIMGFDDYCQPSFGRDLINVEEGLVVLRNGSFLTNDKLYISSQNSCIDLNTGEIIAPEEYEGVKRQAENMLNYSDSILMHDLSDDIKAYLEKQRP